MGPFELKVGIPNVVNRNFHLSGNLRGLDQGQNNRTGLTQRAVVRGVAAFYSHLESQMTDSAAEARNLELIVSVRSQAMQSASSQRLHTKPVSDVQMRVMCVHVRVCYVCMYARRVN